MPLLKSLPGLGRFLTVGFAGTLVNLGSLALLATLLSLPHFIAAVLATEISIIHNFFWNDRWTFRASSAQASGIVRFIRFQVVTSFTALFSLALFGLFYQLLGWYYLVAQLVAVGLATIINYGANSRFTWGASRVRPI
ncbi:MAG TPA: GtrA family protein [Chloroflexia bacterium]|nr:GtrA family protein [Chloroflexia bacterium]